jgi:hypothetical protein
MFLAILLIEAGAVFIYAGVKGKSVIRLFMGDNQTPAQLPQGSIQPIPSGSQKPSG